MAGILNAEVAFPQFPALDQYGPNTSILLHGDGTNGAQNNTFLDSSTNNFTITRNGNTTQGTFSPFSQPNGYWSNFFNGSSRLNVAQTTPFNFGTGAFTVECWVFRPATSAGGGYECPIGGHDGSASTWGMFIYQNTNAPSFYINGSLYSSTILVPNNAWTHLAAVRDGSGNFVLYVNGVAGVSASNAGSITVSSGGLYIGRDAAVNAYFNGYISNARVIKGQAAYSANFTPSTFPLTTTSQGITAANVSLLTCQSNYFKDNSTNAYSVTVANGAPSVQAFHPISAPTAYYPAVNGGAGYFDGSGDYLSMTSGTSLGSGDFTISCWVYLTSAPASETPAVCSSYNYYTSGFNGNFVARVSTDNLWRSFNGQSSQASIDGSFSWATNTWYYMSWVRSGSTVTVYRNGVSLGSVTDSKTLSDTANGYVVGSSRVTGSISNNFPGYISNFRVVVGSAITTVPTAPDTAISGTALLLSCTNAGIIDSVSQNQLETVGNAQVSTTQSKFGGASMYFDGTGDYLVSPTGNSFVFGASDFTVECWVNIPSNPTGSSPNTYYTIFENQILGGLGSRVNSFVWLIQSSGVMNIYTNNSFAGASSSTVPLNQWVHLALVRVGSSSTTYYINGNASGTVSLGTNLTTGGCVIGTLADTPTDGNFKGYIDDFRITKGIARYTQNFTPPQNAYPNYGPLTNIPTVDPNFKNTTLLLHGNGTNGAQNNTFLDSSTNNFTITRNGNTTQGTFTPFSQPNGWWSNYFGGTGNYITAPAGTSFAIGQTGTVEGWYYWTVDSEVSGVSNKRLFCQTNNSSSLDAYVASRNIYLHGGGASTVGSNIQANQWYHIAVVYNSGAVSVYINGVSQGLTGTITGYNITNTTNVMGINTLPSQTPYEATCYISNFRVIKGTAVYTSNFTPSTLPLTAITNTSLLTCQSSRFVDNSANAFTITPSGTPTVQNFYPFFPPLDYSTAAIGGSAYFDGSGDYLTAPDSSAWLLSGDFTIEAWVYPTSFGGGNGRNPIVGQWPGGTATNDAFVAYLNSTGYVALYYGIGGTNASVNGTSQAAKLNSWNHVAITRSGSTVRFYVNGVVDSTTATVSGSFNDSNAVLSVGYFTPGTQSEGSYTGYITDTRIVNGTALYTGSTYTVPTAPLTAITNTSLLLSCTNAGIFDNASKNDLETVGNAQISTTQSKFGGSSMYFDGSGDYLDSQGVLVGALGDFTVEGWFYSSTATTALQGVFDLGTNSNLTSTGSIMMYLGNTSTGSAGSLISILAATNNSSWAINAQSPSGSISDNTWTHFAVVRNGGTIAAYINGNLVISSTAIAATTSLYTGTNLNRIGQEAKSSSPPNYFSGYIDDFRVTKGLARYTYNFTPPAAPFPNK